MARSPWTSVFFEAPGRLPATLEDLGRHLEAGRRVVVCREITKVFEEFRTGTPEELRVYYAENPPRGEITILVEGSDAREEMDAREARRRARELLEQGLSRRDAVDLIVRETSWPRNAVYRVVHSI